MAPQGNGAAKSDEPPVHTHRRAGDPTSWQHRAPRWVLVTLLALVGGAVVAQEGLWRLEMTSAPSRLSSVEARVASIEESQKKTDEQINDMRRDQLDFYRWMAERSGDRAKAKQMESRLQELDR